MLESRRDVSRELDIDRVCRDARDDKRYNGFPACPGRIGGEGGHKLGEEESFSLARRWIRGKFSARDRRNSIVEDGAAGKQRRVKFLSGWILAGGRIGRSNDSRKVFYLPGLRLTSDLPLLGRPGFPGRKVRPRNRTPSPSLDSIHTIVRIRIIGCLFFQGKRVARDT